MPTTTLALGSIEWTNIVQPTPEDIRLLGEQHPKFHPLNLQDCLTELEYPKIDHHDDYLFVVVQIPILDASQGLACPAEVDIFLAQGILVTSHRGELKAIHEMFERASLDQEKHIAELGHGAGSLLYHLLNNLVESSLPILQRMDHNLRHIEEHIFDEDTRHLLRELAEIRRNIIVLRRILHPQLDIVRGLEQGNWSFLHDELDLYWGDIGDHLAQYCSLLDEDAEVVSGLSDTVDTLASHRIDEVVRLLTIVTILSLPLSLLATIFGMNILMPFAEHPLLFFLLISTGIILTLWLMWYFRRRNWF